jgi:serine/threonine protein kinase
MGCDRQVAETIFNPSFRDLAFPGHFLFLVLLESLPLAPRLEVDLPRRLLGRHRGGEGPLPMNARDFHSPLHLLDQPLAEAFASQRFTHHSRRIGRCPAGLGHALASPGHFSLELALPRLHPAAFYHGGCHGALRFFFGAQLQVEQRLQSEGHWNDSTCERSYAAKMVAQAPQRKYRIERYLAEGGMGAIYLGKKLGAGGFEKEVVLKQLLPEFTERPEFRDLFFREAKISASLDHVNIVRTVDLVSSEDSLFIVMEYVRGADLRTIGWRARLARNPLSPQAVLHVALEILAGLAYAHGRRAPSGAPLGIIHRDVSPSNILCSAQGDVKLSDFGIAKASTFSSVFYRVRGKVGYMSPEQATNQPLDARSDLFSVAVCIFETLTGERLFTGDLQTPPEEIYGQEIPRLAVKRPDLPTELEIIFEQALARDREDRFLDARAFAESLRDVARRQGLLYSAPQLAAELAGILGPDPDDWTQDESNSSDPDRLPPGKLMEGREAASIGVVDGPLLDEDYGGTDTVSLRPQKTPVPVELYQPPPAPGPQPPPVPVYQVRPPDRPVELAPHERTPFIPPPPPAFSPPPPRARRTLGRPGLIAAAYLLLLGAGIAAGIAWTRYRQQPRATTPIGAFPESGDGSR